VAIQLIPKVEGFIIKRQGLFSNVASVKNKKFSSDLRYLYLRYRNADNKGLSRFERILPIRGNPRLNDIVGQELTD
jgi:hypothetical protein